MNEIETLQSWVRESRSIVFFGGAGVSTESGIPDFRSVDGLYNQKYRFPPETILSHTFFRTQPEEFFRFYRDKMLYEDARPNAAHRALAEWEKAGRLSCVITQNIDGLHQAAGSKKVCELHGTTKKNHCVRCGKFYLVETVLHGEGVPKCGCGGVIKPDVVLYEESLPEGAIAQALHELRKADMVIVGGTSLSVYPAASFVTEYRGSRLVLINLSATPMDSSADLVIRGKIGEVLDQIVP